MSWKLARITTKLTIYVGNRLCKNTVLHRYVFAFPLNLLIACKFYFFTVFLKHCLRMCTLEKFRVIESSYHVVETRLLCLLENMFFFRKFSFDNNASRARQTLNK